MLRCMAAVVIAAATISSAFACACCSNTAQRSVHTQKIDGRITAQIEQLRFGPTAKIAVGERDDHPISGLEAPVEDFAMTVTQLNDRITFALRDKKDRAGTLSLVRPRTISIFEVDPRDTEDFGLGPNLDKEWDYHHRRGRRRHLPPQHRTEPATFAGAAWTRQFRHRRHKLQALDAAGARPAGRELHILRRDLREQRG